LALSGQKVNALERNKRDSGREKEEERKGESDHLALSGQKVNALERNKRDSGRGEKEGEGERGKSTWLSQK
jgi:hypothetical protein